MFNNILKFKKDPESIPHLTIPTEDATNPNWIEIKSPKFISEDKVAEINELISIDTKNIDSDIYCEKKNVDLNDNSEIISDDDEDIEDKLDRYLTPITPRQTTQQINKEDDKLNYLDKDENIEDKFYVISIDNIPHFYETNLTLARQKMWDIANSLLKTARTNCSSENYLISQNTNHVKIVCPYQFFMITYHHVLFELRLDYVIQYNMKLPQSNLL